MTQAEVRKLFIQAYPGVRLPMRKGFWYRCAHCGVWCGRPGGEKANIPDHLKNRILNTWKTFHPNSPQIIDAL